MKPIVSSALLQEIGLTPDDISFESGFTEKHIGVIQTIMNEVSKKRKYLKENVTSVEKHLSHLEERYSHKTSNVFGKLFSSKSTIEDLALQIEQTKSNLGEFQKQLQEWSINLGYLLSNEQVELFGKVSEAFDKVCQSEKIWDVVLSYANRETKSSAKTTVERTEVKFSKIDFEFIISQYQALYFQNANGTSFCIFPQFVCFLESPDNFRLADIKGLSFQFIQQRFQESEDTIPSDSKIIDRTWAKVNKDGSPDLRYSGNYQIPVVKYANFHIKHSAGLEEEYHISNYSSGEQFAEEFSKYLGFLKGTLSPEGSPLISRDYFSIVKFNADKLNRFLKKLQSDNSFGNFILSVDALTAYVDEGAEQGIRTLFFLDVLKCFNYVCDIYNFRSKEGFAVMYLQGKCLNFNLDEYSDIDSLYRLEENYIRMYDTTKETRAAFSIDDKEFLLLSYLLNVFDQDLNEEYLSLLYQFASVVIKADGTVSATEEQLLKRIKQIPQVNVPTKDEKVHVEQHVKVSDNTHTETLEAIMAELENLTGLIEVKQEISTLINFIKIQKAREFSGLKSTNISYHIIFTGNPGTGKTTVARIVSKLYKSLGVLQQGQLVETDRSGLVGEYVGHTAVKVNRIVDSALHGVLFVDEAYALASEGQNDFGKEAVSTLIKRIEDDRDKLIVILAGYTNEMRGFTESNPGIRSRFNRYITFSDYTPDELFSIFKGQCKKLEYVLTDSASEKVASIFRDAYAARDKSFGNGRFVRNIFEKTLERQANRLASITQLDKEVLTTIEASDIP